MQCSVCKHWVICESSSPLGDFVCMMCERSGETQRPGETIYRMHNNSIILESTKVWRYISLGPEWKVAMGQTSAICEDVLPSVVCTMICEYVMDLKETIVALVTNRIGLQCERSNMEEARRVVDALCVISSPSYFYLLRETRIKELFLDLCYCL
jgi:hypothetical protein